MRIIARVFIVMLIMLVVFGVYAFSRGIFFIKKEPRKASPVVASIEANESDKGNEEPVYGDPTNDDPWVEMEQLVKGFYAAAGRDCSGTIRTIDATGDVEKLLESSHFTYQQAGNKLAYSVDSLQVVMTEQLLVVANAELKTVSVAARSGRVDPGPFDLSQFKQIMVDRKADAIVTQSGDMKMLTIDHIEDPQIQGYRIYYDPSTYEIRKMVVGFVRLTAIDGGTTVQQALSDTESEEIDTYTYFVEIEYLKSIDLDPKKFDPISSMLTIVDGHTQLTRAFEKYQLQNVGE